MNLPNDDRELERLLHDGGGELGTLYRKLSRVEPPRRLDRNVLGEAARAVHGRAPRRQRWLVGWSSAAGIVFAAGIAWHIGHDALRNPTPAGTNLDARVQSGATYVPVGSVHAPQVAPAPVAAEVEAGSASRAAAEKARVQPAPAPAPVAAPRAFPADAMRPRAAAKSLAAPAASAVPAASTAAAAPQLESAAPAAAPAAGSMAVTSGSGAAAGSGAANLEAITATGDKRSAPATDLKRSAELRNDLRLSLGDWIRRVRWLLAQGRHEQAVESLQLLRRTHPEVELPADLQSLP